MTLYPRTDIEKEIVSPRDEAQGSQNVSQDAKMLEISVIVGVVAEGRDGDENRQHTMIFFQITFREDTNQEELKQGECEPVSAFGSTEFGEKQWRWCQKQQEDDRRHDLNHKFVFYHRGDSPPVRFEEPTTDKEKTWQTEQKEDIVPPHPPVTQAEMADM